MKRKEKVFEIIFLLVACISIVAVAMICIFLFANGIPAMGKIGLENSSADRCGSREMINMVSFR